MATRAVPFFFARTHPLRIVSLDQCQTDPAPGA